jgi:hypothetical protein
MGSSHNQCRLRVPAKVERVVAATARSRLSDGIPVAGLASDQIGPELIRDVIDTLVPDGDPETIGAADRFAHIALFNFLQDNKNS